MKPRHLAELLLLAAIWGASYLFMRLGAAEWGPAPLAALRAAGGALVLLPLVVWRREAAALRRHWRPILVVALTNSALPFLCFAYAALSITAGLSALFTAAAPLFAALIAWAWLSERPAGARALGLAIGFAGVAGLAWSHAGFRDADALQRTLAVAACLLAAAGYGYSACYTRKRLQGVPPVATAAGSQLGAAVLLALPAAWSWPAVLPGATAWWSLAMLAVLCTGVAYVLYFRLVARAGATNTSTVAFLVPAFAVGWGALVLGEHPAPATWAGCAVILAGTALATGAWRFTPGATCAPPAASRRGAA